MSFFGTMRPPVIKTDNLLLRPYNVDEASRLTALLADGEVAKHTRYIPFPYEESFAIAWINSLPDEYGAGRQLVLAIALKESDTLIGTISFSMNKPGISQKQAELGYWIGQEYWGKGYCTEAARGFLYYGFEQLQLESIFAEVTIENSASAKVLQKLNMIESGTRQDWFEAREKDVKLVSYCVTASDFLRLYSASVASAATATAVTTPSGRASW